MTDKLLHCPFCGGEVDTYHSPVSHEGQEILHKPKTGGNNCGLYFDDFNLTKGTIVQAWNNRIPDATSEGFSINELNRRIEKAITLCSDFTDGGEECRGRDSELAEIIKVLRGEKL